jgi:hypothetical protein
MGDAGSVRSSFKIGLNDITIDTVDNFTWNGNPVATYKEGILYLPSKYFTPVDNGSGGL